MEHEMDFETYFCTRCGASKEEIVDLGTECRDDVIAINHIIARKKMDLIVDKVLELMNK